MVWLLVGLGNPGPRYKGTRHNFGFEVVEQIARDLGVSWRQSSQHNLIAEARLVGQTVLLAKPQTYMNLSGRAVAELVEAEGVETSNLLVFLDDIALPLGTLRFRPQGGDGGHLGLASILRVMGTSAISRGRLGILPEAEPEDLSDFVLDPFTEKELETVSGVVERACSAARVILTQGIDKAMSLYNQAPCSS